VDAVGQVVETLERGALRTVQTPQAFRFAALHDAHRRASAAGRTGFTDDAALMEWAGAAVSVFPGESRNVKLTTADDFRSAEQERMASLGDVRIGAGYDVHAFGDGDHVMLGGLRIAHERGLSGHSDADVVLHAAVDAILGALADGDIGQHFPPSDPRWRGAASDMFLRDAMERLRARGGMLAHLDVSIVCEAPRIGPHREAMRRRIAEVAGVDPGRVAVKATTNEKLGFVGRREGMAAMVTATVRLPWDAS
jgi:2-C-methyl-D-erythritol 4-phosphate cytidylyltransferase/2-C-methyl-D-erythritol 2,4-cyclodiphosphate synthase